MLVDDEDFDNASRHRWWTSIKGSDHRYVYTKINGKDVSFRRLILGIDSIIILHKNGNRLDLRRENILVFDDRSKYVSVMGKLFRKKNPEFNPGISKGAQGSKGGKSVKKYTQYIGVWYNASATHQWGSTIRHNWKLYHLGCYAKEEHAAMAYDLKALELFGPGATVNFPGLSIEELSERLEPLRAEVKLAYPKILSDRHQGMRQKNIIKTSEYVGVSRSKKVPKKPWRATIYHMNKQHYIGYFATEKDAALAYDKKALELFGEGAKLNFPDK